MPNEGLECVRFRAVSLLDGGLGCRRSGSRTR